MPNFPPTRILVAVDFGDASSHAVRIAGALAAHTHARLAAIHAESLEAPPYFTHSQIEALEQQQIEARGRAARYLTTVASRLTTTPVEPIIAGGPPAAAVLDEAGDADLVVVGTHGRRGPSRWWLGSVAERIVRHARVPVLVVRADEARHDAADHFRHILVVAGGGAVDDRAEHYAAALAATFDGQPVERLTRCTETVAEDRQASLLAVGFPVTADGRLPDTAERMIRTCRLPMLFVPGM
jgi:nucleotide-binding universal stress UspA family protein